MKHSLLKSGASLFELLVAIGIFTVGVVGVLFLVTDAGVTTRSGVERTQAVFLVQEGLEAVRTIRDNDFASLIDGAYGIDLVDGVWVLDSNPDIQDGFTRSITIAPGEASDSKNVTSTVSWLATPSQTQSVDYTQLFTKWDHAPLTEIECFDVDLSGASIEQGAVHKIVRYIWISNPSCGYAIQLDKIILTWDIPSNDLFKVRIASFFKWQGTAVSGETLDLVPNETLESGAPAVEIDQLRWKDSILGTDIGVTFIMSDGSQESFVIPAFTE